MKKVLLLVMAMLFAFGVLATPAYAATGSILHCSKQPDPAQCRGGVYGTRSTIEIANYNQPYPDVTKTVSSVYILQHDPRTYCCADNYVEFGWKRERSLIGGGISEKMFVCWEDDNGAGGQECNEYDGPGPRGEYIIYLYQDPGSLGIFRFAYKKPDGTWYTIPFSLNPAGTWNYGFPGWGVESQNDADIPDEHKVCYILNANLNPTGWVPANGSQGVTEEHDSHPTYFATIFPGTGVLGDWIVYNP